MIRNIIALGGMACLFCASQPLWAQQKATFANDIVVSPTTGRFYKNNRVATSYNGVTYVGRLWATTQKGPYQHWEVLKSTDNGLTWTVFQSELVAGTTKFTAFDMIAAGESVSAFRLWTVRTILDTATGNADLKLSAFNSGGTNTQTVLPAAAAYRYFNTNNVPRGYSSVALATDSRKNAIYSNPYCISIVASKEGNNDSIVVWTDKEAGTILNRRALTNSSFYFRNVAAAIGACGNRWNHPMLGLVYEERSNETSLNGTLKVRYIYAEDATDFANGGPFAVGSNNVGYTNPSIAMAQTQGPGSGSGFDDFRTVVMYDNYGVGTVPAVEYCVTDDLVNAAPDFSGSQGFATLGANTGQPYVVFDPARKNFLLTWYNSSTQKLPYNTLALNAAATARISVTPNYRDATAALTTEVAPRMDVNMITGKAAFVWNDTYKTMFDAEARGAAAVEDAFLNAREFRIYPNPAENAFTVSMSADEADEATLVLQDITGRMAFSQPIKITTGANQLSINGLSLPDGVYLLQISGNKTHLTTPILIRH